MICSRDALLAVPEEVVQNLQNAFIECPPPKPMRPQGRKEDEEE
jgi:hypothetical protein